MLNLRPVPRRPEGYRTNNTTNVNTHSPPPMARLVFDPLIKKLFSPVQLYI